MESPLLIDLLQIVADDCGCGGLESETCDSCIAWDVLASLGERPPRLAPLTAAELVWGKSFLTGHVHSFARGACRCGAKPSGNRPQFLNNPESEAPSALGKQVESEQSRTVA